MIRARQDKETILPLNHRERNRYVSLSSVKLIKTERVKLAKSATFLSLTSVKICIYIIMDYSLYWILDTIRYHGRIQTQVFVNNYLSNNWVFIQIIINRLILIIRRSISQTPLVYTFQELVFSQNFTEVL